MEWIAIVGSRRFPERLRVIRFVRKLAESNPTCCVITGDATGVDTWVYETCREMKLKVLVCSANWDKWGKQAGYFRNKEVVTLADRVICWHDGESKGTQLVIDLAREEQKTLTIKLPKN